MDSCLKKVLNYYGTIRRADTFGMKLDAEEGLLFVGDGHDYAVEGFGDDFKVFGEGFAFADE